MKKDDLLQKGSRIGNALWEKIWKIMRLTGLFLLISFVAISAGTYSQNTRFSFRMENRTLNTLFLYLEQNSGYRFAYNKSDLDDTQKISCEFTNESIDQILKKVLDTERLSISIKNEYIIIARKENAVGNSLSTGQPVKTISGRVSDSLGAPLPGVSVVIKGTTTGVITDMDGNYTLSKVSENATLVFSFVGMKTQEIAVGNKTTINIELVEETIGIEEVVAVGYGTQKKSDITGSIASIKAERLKDVSVVNAAGAMQGKAAGVDIVAAGQKPGAGSTVRIRGTRSFKASNDPLYIIDGIPFNRGINDLNPADIESMEVLKDASATAIYGSRGANGVILITTKRAKTGSSEITYDYYYGFQEPQKSYDMMDGARFLEMNREANRKNGTYPDGFAGADKDIAILKYKDAYVQESVRKGYDEAGNYNPANVRSYNWSDDALQTGIIQSHQLSFTGGNDKSKVMISAGYYKNEGIVVGQDYERYSFRLNAEYNITSWLTVGGSTAFTNGITNNGSDIYFNTLRMNPLASPVDEDGFNLDRPGNDPTLYNPFYDIDNYVSEQKQYRFMGSFYLNLNFGKGLKYRMNFGPDFDLSRTGNFYGSQSFSKAGGLSSASDSQQQYLSFVLENILYYDKTFKKHRFGATLMQGLEQEKREDLSGNVSDLPYEYQEFYNLGSASTITGVGSDYVQWNMLSYMGRINYTFDEKYMLTLTGRYDGSSRLSDENKFTFFPSAALAWRVSEESFMKPITFIDNLKFRLGYGVTGNSSVNPYETLGSLTRTSYATDDNAVYGYRPNLLYNPDLVWEKTSQYNIGIDFSTLNGRIAGTIDTYRQKTNDLLLGRQLPTASGFSSITQNIGSTRNTGLEITVNTVNIENKNGLVWTTDLMFYTNKEEIVSLYQGKVDDVGNKWFIGHPIGTYYDYKFDGIWQNSQAELDRMALFNANGATFAPGDIKLVDVVANNKITSDDRVILGSTVPKWTASITNTFKYKGIDFSFFLYARYGQMAQTSTNFLTLDGRYNSLDIDYWTPENPSNKYPRPNNKMESPNYIGAVTYEDASFLKLKSITLGYTLPQSLSKKIMIKRCRFFMTAENPMVYTNYSGLDPEGGEKVTPSTRNLLLGLNVTF
jgi:TonB-linked SusC/RagA family outer membrane protein